MFGMKIENDLLHREIENQLLPVYFSLYLSFFSLSTFFVKKKKEKKNSHILRKRLSGGIVRFSDSSSWTG